MTIFAAVAQTRFHGRFEESEQRCEHPTCQQAGEFRAPGHRPGGWPQEAANVTWPIMCAEAVVSSASATPRAICTRFTALASKSAATLARYMAGAMFLILPPTWARKDSRGLMGVGRWEEPESRAQSSSGPQCEPRSARGEIPKLASSYYIFCST